MPSDQIAVSHYMITKILGSLKHGAQFPQRALQQERHLILKADDILLGVGDD